MNTITEDLLVLRGIRRISESEIKELIASLSQAKLVSDVDLYNILDITIFQHMFLSQPENSSENFDIELLIKLTESVFKVIVAK